MNTATGVWSTGRYNFVRVTANNPLLRRSATASSSSRPSLSARPEPRLAPDHTVRPGKTFETFWLLHPACHPGVVGAAAAGIKLHCACHPPTDSAIALVWPRDPGPVQIRSLTITLSQPHSLYLTKACIDISIVLLSFNIFNGSHSPQKDCEKRVKPGNLLCISSRNILETAG